MQIHMTKFEDYNRKKITHPINNNSSFGIGKISKVIKRKVDRNPKVYAG